MEPSAHTATCILNQICLPTSLWRSWIRRLLRRKRHLSWVRHHTHIAVLAWVLPCFCMISKWRCDSWYMIWPQVPRSKTATIAPEAKSSDESYSLYSLSLEMGSPGSCVFEMVMWYQDVQLSSWCCRSKVAWQMPCGVTSHLDIRSRLLNSLLISKYLLSLSCVDLWNTVQLQVGSSWPHVAQLCLAQELRICDITISTSVQSNDFSKR